MPGCLFFAIRPPATPSRKLLPPISVLVLLLPLFHAHCQGSAFLLLPFFHVSRGQCSPSPSRLPHPPKAISRGHRRPHTAKRPLNLGHRIGTVLRSTWPLWMFAPSGQPA